MFRKIFLALLLTLGFAHAETQYSNPSALAIVTPFPGQEAYFQTATPNANRGVFTSSGWRFYQDSAGTKTATPTFTNTATNTVTNTATLTATNTPTNTVTSTPTNTATFSVANNQPVTYNGTGNIVGVGPTSTPLSFSAGTTMVSVAYQTTSGVAGGNLVSTATPYPINSYIQNDNSVGGAITNNSFTLAAGTYKVVSGFVQLDQAGALQLNLYNITDSVVVARTSSIFANNGTTSNGIVGVWAPGYTFTIAGTKTFAIYVLGGTNGSGSQTMGFPSSTGLENYFSLCLLKTN